MVDFIFLWSAYVIAFVVFISFIMIEYLRKPIRTVVLIVLGIICVIQISLGVMGLDISNDIETLLIFQYLGTIAFSLLIMMLAKVLPVKLKAPYFILVSLLLLPPFTAPAGFGEATQNFGLVLIPGLVDGKFKEFPVMFFSYPFFHTISFSVVAIVSYLISIKYLSNTSLQATPKSSAPEF